MNKQLSREITRLESFRHWDKPGCPIGAAHADYVALSLTALHRANGPKVRREIETLIQRWGIAGRVQARNGCLIAVADA
jgi:hypothetical protein